MEEDSYIVSNFHSICRLCLRKSGLMSPLFEHAAPSPPPPHEGAATVPLYTMLAELVALTMAPDDGLPSRICHRCLVRSEECVQFRALCAASDAKLRRLTRKLPSRQPPPASAPPAPPSLAASLQPVGSLAALGLSGHLGSPAPEPNQQAAYSLEPDLPPEDSVVMVVDPSLDYDTSEASDADGENDADNDADNDNDNDAEVDGDADGDNEGDAEGEMEGEVDDGLDESLASKVFMCQYCDQAFTEAERCRAHERLEHDARAPWGCAACGLVFAERAGQAAHARAVHACARPYSCATCDKAFGRRSDLRKHSVVHTGVRPYRCQFCHKSFSRNTNLSKHLRIHSGQKPHVCPQCPRSFISKGDLSRHALVHSGAKPFACSVCSLTFGRRDKLVKHEARHARADPEPSPPTHVDKGDMAHENMVITLDPYKNLSDETAIDADGDVFAAPDIGFDAPDIGFDERNLLDLPRVPDHISGEGNFSFEPRQMFKSEPSPDRVSDDQDLFNGEIKQEDDEPMKNTIQCPLCPRQFSSTLDFNSHMQLHEGIKSFHCKQCNKTFMRKRELDRHAIVHTGFKPYECTRCDKKFGRKDKLVRHERIHDEKKEYSCFECPSTFSRKDTLMSHIKTHFPGFKDINTDGDLMSDDMDDVDNMEDDLVGHE